MVGEYSQDTRQMGVKPTGSMSRMHSVCQLSPITWTRLSPYMSFDVYDGGLVRGTYPRLSRSPIGGR